MEENWKPRSKSTCIWVKSFWQKSQKHKMEKRTGNLDAVGARRKAGSEGRPQDAAGSWFNWGRQEGLPPWREEFWPETWKTRQVSQVQGQGAESAQKMEGAEGRSESDVFGWCEHNEPRVGAALTDHEPPPDENQRCIHHCVFVPWFSEEKRKGRRTKGRGGEEDR